MAAAYATVKKIDVLTDSIMQKSEEVSALMKELESNSEKLITTVLKFKDVKAILC